MSALLSRKYLYLCCNSISLLLVFTMQFFHITTSVSARGIRGFARVSLVAVSYEILSALADTTKTVCDILVTYEVWSARGCECLSIGIKQ